jgi:hypothetical protein
MEEVVLDVEMMNRPVLRHWQRKHSPDGCRLEHRAEGLIVVDVEALIEI